MAIDDLSIAIVDEICLQGFSRAFAYSALADARDLICRRIEAEIQRGERAEATAAARRIREGLADER